MRKRCKPHWPKPEAWPFIAASVTVHIAYYLMLTGAYKNGDLSLTYPLMRGTAPLLVALVSVATLGEHLSSAGWLAGGGGRERRRS